MGSKSVPFWRGAGDLLVGIGVIFVFVSLAQFLFAVFFPEIESQKLVPEHYPFYYLGLMGTQIFGFGLPAWVLIRFQMKESIHVFKRIDLLDLCLVLGIVFGELLFLNLLKVPYEVYEQIFPESIVSKFRQLSQFQMDFLQTLTRSQSLFYSILAMAIVPAICEELLFRNYFFKGLLRFLPLWWSVIISSFFFSFFHMEMEGIIARFFLGVVLALLFYYRSYQLIFPILFHLFHNGIQTIFIYYFPEEHESLEGGLWPFISVIGFLVFGISFFLFLRRRKLVIS